MDETPGERPPPRRAAGLVRASALVPTDSRGVALTWDRLVGPTLAAESAFVGLDAAGTIRVAARNDAARREILAREEAIVAAFNVPFAVTGRRATGLSCWVAAQFYKPAPSSRSASPGPTPMARPEEIERARAEVVAIAPSALPAVADALARVRARAIVRRGRGG